METACICDAMLALRVGPPSPLNDDIVERVPTLPHPPSLPAPLKVSLGVLPGIDTFLSGTLKPVEFKIC